MLNLLTLINATRGREAMHKKVLIQTSQERTMQVAAIRINEAGDIVLSALRQDTGHMQTAWRAAEGVK